ncbi:NAD(P)-binding protein [Piedraia hortae CBS 480.64]|uniref:NAD(P)-binding protein n=1 Tax=Piedraia hortae CBS 480.64 TaxID=1314780 RepID=A0A6A7C3V9_9PEZI|nr:NAD(P)-binding protein [Piedraia hortae CBS 480.64]
MDLPPTRAHAKLRLPASTGPPSDTNLPTPKVWVVFMATGQIGRKITQAALDHGDSVTAVGCTQGNALPEVQNWHKNCLGLFCDVRLRESIQIVLDTSIKHWGRIDIIVNATSYGIIGACEDQNSSDLRSQLENNFLGTLNIIQLSLPYFRQRSSLRPLDRQKRPIGNAGRYLILSSTAGALGVPGLGPYYAIKSAIEGMIESMLYEVDAFDIKATLVEPGHLRLEEPVNNSPSQQSRYGQFLIKSPSAPYNNPTSPAAHAQRVMQWLGDRQPTSVTRCGELVWQLGHCKYPPLRLLLGSLAVESVRDRLRSVIEEIEDWKYLHFVSSEGRESDDSDEEEQES